MVRLISQLFRPAVVVLTLALLPSLAHAQGAIITGRVTDRDSGQPLSDVTILVSGIPRGSRTGENGQYTVAGVPPGSVQVRALRLGFRSQSTAVQVTAGATITVNIALEPSVTALDEVMVTATGETQRVRESGVNTGRIDTSMVKMANVNNFSNVLAARVSGVLVQEAGGTTGGASRVRIRGANSVNLDNTPLLMVDGVRVENSTGSTSIGVGGQTPSRWNDISPDDIETIDVIKGPAAAALYGTAAANGVIRVTTKRGRVGSPRISSFAEYGGIDEFGNYPENYRQIGITNSTGARNVDCNLDVFTRGLCTPKTDSLVSTSPIRNADPFRNGWRSMFGANVNGGTPMVQYFVSGDYEREEGVYPSNWQRKGTARGNVNAQLRQNLQFGLNSGYVRIRGELPQNDNNTLGAIAGALIGKAFDCHPSSLDAVLGFPRDASCGSDSLGRGYRTANHPSTRFMAIQTRQNVDRITGSTNLAWQPLSWLNMISVTGLDLVNRWDHETWPPGVIDVFIPDGERTSNRADIRNYTATLSAVGTFTPLEDLRVRTTAGTQWNREFFSRTDAYGEALLPGTSTLNGASSQFEVDETTTEVVTVGGIASQALEWRDRMFLSYGLRTDKNSNFGANLAWVTYPSLQFSWVLDEEAFFPVNPVLSRLRLRSGWGKSGQRPAFREADKFFQPVAVTVEDNSVTGITLGGAGNAELRPEVTSEWEFGSDFDLFERTFHLEVTRYNKQTRDALIGRRLAPSLGASVTQVINLGRVENKGWEYLLDVRPVGIGPAELSLTLTGSVNDNKVVDLGEGIEPIIFGLGGDTQRHQNGYPLGAYFHRRLVSWSDANGDSRISRNEIVLSDTAEFLGNPFGRTEMSITPQVELFGWLQLRALFNHRGGLTLNNSTEYFRCSSSGSICRGIQDPNAPLEEQARAISTRPDAAGISTRGAYMEKADFWKLRELSFTASLPRALTEPLRVSGASITVAGRNLKTWTDYTGLDPELNLSADTNFNTAEFLTQPPVRYWTTRFNVTF